MFLGGFLIPLLGLFGMIVFSFSLFVNSSLVMLWLFLELCGLCLIPLFFSGGACLSMVGLFYYVVFSGVSSCLLLMGILLPDCVFFLLGGLLMKFGVFPLWGWVYRVCCGSNWFVIWGISSVLKVSFIIFPLFLVFSSLSGPLVVFFCALGCLFLSCFFWFFVFDWKSFWCHVMLSSSGVLVGLSLSGCAIDGLSFVFIVYFFWASFVLFFLSFCGDDGDFLSTPLFLFLFSFLLLTLPFSFSIFYKLVVCSCIVSSGLFLLLCWVVYSFSEQLYLFLFVTGLYRGKTSSSCVELV